MTRKIVFTLDEAESARVDEWVAEQIAKKATPQTAIGGRFTFSFTPTSLGSCVTVEDCITKETFDPIDYDKW